MENRLEISERELKEIQHALYYDYYLMHGTVGHNMLALIAKLATVIGFRLDENNILVTIPDSVVILEEKKR